MLPHQQRVIDEAAELKEKFLKLHAFFSTDVYRSMDPLDRQIMKDQHDAMIHYYDLLVLRIERFNA